MNKKSITKYTSSSCGLLGVALVLTAALIYAFPSSEVLVLFTPYTGSRLVLLNILAIIGVISTLLGYALRRMITKC